MAHVGEVRLAEVRIDQPREIPLVVPGKAHAEGVVVLRVVHAHIGVIAEVETQEPDPARPENLDRHDESRRGGAA